MTELKSKVSPFYGSAVELQVAVVDGVEVAEGDGSGARAAHVPLRLVPEETSGRSGIFVGAAQRTLVLC